MVSLIGCVTLSTIENEHKSKEIFDLFKGINNLILPIWRGKSKRKRLSFSSFCISNMKNYLIWREVDFSQNFLDHNFITDIEEENNCLIFLSRKETLNQS